VKVFAVFHVVLSGAEAPCCLLCFLDSVVKHCAAECCSELLTNKVDFTIYTFGHIVRIFASVPNNKLSRAAFKFPCSAISHFVSFKAFRRDAKNNFVGIKRII